MLAFAPLVPADALVDEPDEGLETCTFVGPDPLGLPETVVEPPPPGGLTLMLVGALTCAFEFTGDVDGRACALTDGAMSAQMRHIMTVNDAVERILVSWGIRDLLR